MQGPPGYGPVMVLSKFSKYFKLFVAVAVGKLNKVWMVTNNNTYNNESMVTMVVIVGLIVGITSTIWCSCWWFENLRVQNFKIYECRVVQCFRPSIDYLILAIHSSWYLDSKQQRQTGRQAQLSNISAARAVSDIIRTTLGPRSMLKVSLCRFLIFDFFFSLFLCTHIFYGCINIHILRFYHTT